MLSPEVREELTKRLRRIEGQTQGIQRMLAEDRDCREVLNQLASVKAATQAVSVMLMKQYALTCLNDPTRTASPEKAVDEVLSLFLRVSD